MPRTLRALPLVFVLLLVVALAAALRFGAQRSDDRGGWVAPPDAWEGHLWSAEQASAVLAIDRMGVYYFNRQPIRRDALPTVLDSVSRWLPHGTPLSVYADHALPAAVVDTALAIVRARGVAAVSLVVESPDGRPHAASSRPNGS